MNCSKQNGHTITELIVYLVLTLLISGYALQAVSSLAKSCIRGREVTKLQTAGDDVLTAMVRDIGNTGLKYYTKKRIVYGSAGSDTVYYDRYPTRTSPDSLLLLTSFTGRYTDTSAILPADSAASFFHWDGTPSDSFELYKGVMNSSLVIDSTVRIRYTVRGDTLWRISQSVQPTGIISGKAVWSRPDSLLLAARVKGVQFQFSEDGRNWIDSPQTKKVRHQMKYVLIQLMTESQRAESIGGAGSEALLGDQKRAVTPNHLVRTFERAAAISNNGILK